MTKPRRNIELKARDPNSERSPTICEFLGAEDRGVLVQRDTYFRVPRGRLKLREEKGGEPHLIAYERPDRIGSRESCYRIAEVSEPDGLKEALGSALGVRVVVKKERRLFIWKMVRIHLETVEGLGSLSTWLGLESVAVALFDNQFLGSSFGDQSVDLGRFDADRLARSEGRARSLIRASEAPIDW